MRRPLFYVVGSILFFGIGVSFWVGYRWLTATPAPSGSVLGAETDTVPSWQGAFLVLAGNDKKLAQWSTDGSVQTIAAAQQYHVVSAALAPDATALLLVTREENGNQVFRLLRRDGAARFLVAVSGIVGTLQYSPDDRFVLFRLLRTGTATSEIDVLDVDKGLVIRIAQDALGAAWSKDGNGILSWTASGSLRFHALALDGTFGIPIALRDDIVGNPVVQPSRTVLLIRRQGDKIALITYDMVTKEDRVLLPLDVPATPQSATLVLSPDGKHALLQTAKESSSASWSLLNTDGTAVTPTPIASPVVRWFDDANVLAQSGTSGIQQYTVATNTVQMFPSANTQLFP